MKNTWYIIDWNKTVTYGEAGYPKPYLPRYTVVIGPVPDRDSHIIHSEYRSKIKADKKADVLNDSIAHVAKTKQNPIIDGKEQPQDVIFRAGKSGDCKGDVDAFFPEYRSKKLLKEANKFHRIPEVPELDMPVKE